MYGRTIAYDASRITMTNRGGLSERSQVEMVSFICAAQLNFGYAAASTDWRLAVRKLHVGTDNTASTQMPDIRLQASPLGPTNTINSLRHFVSVHI